MWTRFSVAAHLGAEELAVRYRAARDPVERSRWQMLWLLVSRRRLGEVAAVTGYSSRWIREVVKRYNAKGPDVLADQRHRNRGAAPLLDAAGAKRRWRKRSARHPLRAGAGPGARRRRGLPGGLGASGSR